MEVTFRNNRNDVNVRNRLIGFKNQDHIDPNAPETEIVEIKYDDGRVSAFPANERDASKSAELGRDVTFAEVYGPQYSAFKNGGNDRARIAVLKAEIKDRQNEIETLKPVEKNTDERNITPSGTSTFKTESNKPSVQGVATPDNPTGAVPKDVIS